MRLVTALVLLVAALPVSAQIYQYTDEKGNRVFTDHPPLGVDATSIKLPAINAVPEGPSAVQLEAAESTDSSSANTAAPPYSQLELSGLPVDEAIRANNGNFSVQVAITPKLSMSHRLQLLIDGQPYGAAGSSTSLHVENIDRGEHRIAVQVVAGDKVVQSSPEQVISVQRVHLGNRAKP